MRLLVTASEMAAMDREAIEEIGIPGVVLMENAGLGVVSVIQDMLGSVAGRRVAIVCGKGNNGGDGYVVARHLHNAGCDVDVYLLAEPEAVRGDARVHLDVIRNMGIPVHVVRSTDDFDPSPEPHLVVDAIFGTGITGPVQGLPAEIIRKINGLGVPVVAVDLPSGLNADTGAVEGPCVAARRTVTMAQIKRGLVLPPGRDYAGQVHVVDIGMPRSLKSATRVRTFLVDRSDAVRALPRRPSDAHKNRVGLVYVVAGSTGMTGAATLTALSALRAGSGLVYLGIPGSLNPILEVKATEVITHPLPEATPGTLAAEAWPLLEERLQNVHVAAVGPGLGTHPSTAQLVERIVQLAPVPLVLDADGLNNLSGRTELLASRRWPTVITPHPGELSRLCGLSTREILADRIEVARRFAQEWRVVLVLKGSPTVTASPDGNVYVNTTGNAGMATGGSGDVLTGIIASLMGQGLGALEAAWLGVYVHGLAGDVARERLGQMGMIAGDILRAVPSVLRALENARDAQP
ncbi:MAG: NAD(P)H-hydrate dehydratase [candidate division KSB1 bacterium]|nr:NAD(P)H-hydrate dehydratase [candidate division KSB1 bacterium]